MSGRFLSNQYSGIAYDIMLYCEKLMVHRIPLILTLRNYQKLHVPQRLALGIPASAF